MQHQVKGRKMNGLQKIIILLGTVALMALCLYPPWATDFDRGPAGLSKISLGYYPIYSDYAGYYQVPFSGPKKQRSGNPFSATWVDIPRLGVEVFGVLAATVGLCLVFSSRRD